MRVEDNSHRMALEAELTHRALHDPLTGLPNRTLLLDRTAHALAAARRSPGVTSLLFLNLNGFKAVNDTHGHDVGDQVLRQFAERLTGLLRPRDTPHGSVATSSQSCAPTPTPSRPAASPTASRLQPPCRSGCPSTSPSS